MSSSREEDLSGEEENGSELAAEPTNKTSSSPDDQTEEPDAAAKHIAQPLERHSLNSAAKQKRTKLALSVMEKTNRKGRTSEDFSKRAVNYFFAWPNAWISCANTVLETAYSVIMVLQVSST